MCARQGGLKQWPVFSGEMVTLEYHHSEAFPPAKGFIVRIASILQVRICYELLYICCISRQLCILLTCSSCCP